MKLNELHAFKNHPFGVRDDEEMRAMVSSVKDKGVTQPAIVRPLEGGGYEIVSGHRRQKASELAGYTDMPLSLIHIFLSSVPFSFILLFASASADAGISFKMCIRDRPFLPVKPPESTANGD